MNIIQKFLYILSWIPFILLQIILALLGLIIVPIGLSCNRWPRFLWLWDNDEHPESPMYNISNFWWLAIRNPVGNFKYLFQDTSEYKQEGNWTEQSMEALDLIKRRMRKGYRWRYAGWKASYRRVWLTKPGKYSEIWFGWKLGSVVPGLGFAIQIRLNRDIGS